MFTGIVEEAGEIHQMTRDEGGRRLRIGTSFEKLHQGQSISVSGACLTVERFDQGWFEVFLSQETLDRTYLSGLGTGDTVNLERALPADGRFDGHFVQGHVDGTAAVTEITQIGDDWQFGFSLPDDLARYVVGKGSIAVDGISLTIADRGEEEFTVAIVPETYDVTTLSEKSLGDPVHVEIDVVAKYAEQLLDGYAGS